MWQTARRRRREWLPGWDAVAAGRLSQWPDLDDQERDRLSELVESLVLTKHWEAARGFQLTQDIVVTIAAHAGLLVLGLDLRVYRDVAAVIVHPRTVTLHGPQTTTIPRVVVDGPRRVSGHASDRRGPVVISWAAVRRDLTRPRPGRSVAIHEFAHKIDAVDGLFDGTPAIASRTQQQAWVRVCTDEYERIRAPAAGPDPVLRAYAAESPSEFFAVATEAFFVQPLELEQHKPALYEVFRAYYGQDTADRARRAVPPQPT
jgi:hypothetical protein